MLTLKRITSTAYGTFGVLIHGEEQFAVTLECPWKDNQVNTSCIPAGVYFCVRVQSPRFGDTFEITDVKGRTHILFHAGNIASNTRGCILIGEKFGS